MPASNSVKGVTPFDSVFSGIEISWSFGFGRSLVGLMDCLFFRDRDGLGGINFFFGCCFCRESELLANTEAGGIGNPIDFHETVHRGVVTTGDGRKRIAGCYSTGFHSSRVEGWADARMDAASSPAFQGEVTVEILYIGLQSPDLAFLLATARTEDFEFAAALSHQSGRAEEKAKGDGKGSHGEGCIIFKIIRLVNQNFNNSELLWLNTPVFCD